MYFSSTKIRVICHQSCGLTIFNVPKGAVHHIFFNTKQWMIIRIFVSMNIEEIRDYCLAKAHTTEELPFGPDTLVYKLHGKIFLLVGLDQVDALCFNVKCDPEYAIQLREEFSQTVMPGYHMNKKHWNTVYCNRELSDVQIFALIDHSYALIWDSLPKHLRTV